MILGSSEDSEVLAGGATVLNNSQSMAGNYLPIANLPIRRQD